MSTTRQVIQERAVMTSAILVFGNLGIFGLNTGEADRFLTNVFHLYWTKHNL